MVENNVFRVFLDDRELPLVSGAKGSSILVGQNKFLDTSKNLPAKKWLKSIDFFEDGKIEIDKLNTTEEIKILSEVVTVNTS